jgi:hypothetical protein
MADPSGEFGREYTCREVVELASEYLEGAMTPQQMTKFELHMNFCDGCFVFVDQIRTAAAMALGVSDDQIPDDLRVRLIEAFRDWKRE